MEQNLNSRVTVVLVTYNSADVIKECLEALKDLPHVIVVDNASGVPNYFHFGIRVGRA